MTIRYNCEKCGQLLKIKDELAGMPNKCPACKTRFTVPAASGESAIATGDSKPNLVPHENDSGILVEEAIRAGARTDSPELSGVFKASGTVPVAKPAAPPKKEEEFDPTDVLSEGAPKKKGPAPGPASGKEKGTAGKGKPADDFDPADFLSEGAPKKPGAKSGPADSSKEASGAAAVKKGDDFDPADFLMEGKPKKAPPRPAAPEPPAAPAPVAETKPETPEVPAEPAEEFDAAEFLIEEAKKAAAPPPPPSPPPGTPPQPRRWGMRQPAAAPNPPPGSAAASAAATALGTIAPTEAQPGDMPDAQPKMVQLPQETPREPIQIGRALKRVGATRWTMFFLSLVASGGIYWWMIQPKLEVPPLGQISGVVTLDGKPLAGAIVTFAPEKREYKTSKNAKGMPLRTAVGITDADGHYTLYYVEGHRGTFLGRNRVSVEPMLNSKGQDLIPSDWGRKSKNAPDVMEGSNPPYNIEMKTAGR